MMNQLAQTHLLGLPEKSAFVPKMLSGTSSHFLAAFLILKDSYISIANV